MNNSSMTDMGLCAINVQRIISYGNDLPETASDIRRQSRLGPVWGLESSEVNKNEEEVETGDSNPENVEEIPEYDSSTDKDEEPEDGDSSIPELDRRSTFLLGGHDTLWTTSQDQQQIPNVKVDLLVSG